MASFVESVRPLLSQLRGLPGQLGLREHSATLYQGSWSGSQTGDGTETDTTVPLLEGGQNPKIRWLSDEQLALANDTTGATVRIGPITPQFPGGGTDLDDMAGTDLSAGDTLHVMITGPKHPSGKRYAVANITANGALGYYLECKPV